ncbi:hypothetical protein BpHYR1_048126, partial [Brachionus plicatilis]
RKNDIEALSSEFDARSPRQTSPLFGSIKLFVELLLIDFDICFCSRLSFNLISRLVSSHSSSLSTTLTFSSSDEH